MDAKGIRINHHVESVTMGTYLPNSCFFDYECPNKIRFELSLSDLVKILDVDELFTFLTLVLKPTSSDRPCNITLELSGYDTVRIFTIAHYFEPAEYPDFVHSAWSIEMDCSQLVDSLRQHLIIEHFCETGLAKMDFDGTVLRITSPTCTVLITEPKTINGLCFAVTLNCKIVTDFLKHLSPTQSIKISGLGGDVLFSSNLGTLGTWAIGFSY